MPTRPNKRKPRKDTPVATTTPTLIPEHVNSENALTFYVSSAEIFVTVYDFRLRIGEILKVGEGKLVIKDLVTLYMSPQHALALTAILANRIRNYEEQYGKIPRLEAPGQEVS